MAFSVNPADTVVQNSEFFNWISDTMYNMVNLVPRIPQKVDIQGEEVKVNSFSTVAVKWLSIEGTGAKDLLNLVLRYIVSIVAVSSVSGALVLAILIIMLWWCIKQCVSSKPNPHIPPSPCGIFRNKHKSKSRIGCRICYTIIALLILAGVLIVAIGGILLNSGVKGVFDRTLPIFDNLIEISGELLEPADEKMTGALDAGDAILAVPNGVFNYMSEDGTLNDIMRDMNTLQYWYNMQNAVVAATKTAQSDIPNADLTNPYTAPYIVDSVHWKWSDLSTKIKGLTCTKDKFDDCNTTYATLKYYTDMLIKPLYNTIALAGSSNSAEVFTSTTKDNLNKTLTDSATADSLGSIPKFNSEVSDTLSASEVSTCIGNLPGSSTAVTLTKGDEYLQALDNLLMYISMSESPFCQTVDNVYEYKSAPKSANCESANNYLEKIRTLISLLASTDSAFFVSSNTVASVTCDNLCPNSYTDCNMFNNLMRNVKTPFDSAQDSLDTMTMAVDNLFYNVSTTIARATRFLGIYSGFVGDYKQLYTAYGDVIIYVLAGFFIAFGALTLLSVFCTYFCAKDTLLCCTICCDQLFFIIIGIFCIISCIGSWALMDIYKDLYKSDSLITFNPLFQKILSLTYWDEEKEETDASTDASDQLKNLLVQKLVDRLLPPDYLARHSSFVPLQSSPTLDNSLPLTNLSNADSYKPPKIQELLPFENLRAGEVGAWFLKDNENARDTVKLDFLTPMQNEFKKVVSSTENTEDIFPKVTFTKNFNDSLKESADTANDKIDFFISNITDITLERKAIRDMLYDVLDPVLVTVAHSAAVTWAGSVIILAFAIPAEFILMCGRTLWQPVGHFQNEYIHTKDTKTVREVPEDEKGRPRDAPRTTGPTTTRISTTTRRLDDTAPRTSTVKAPAQSSSSSSSSSSSKDKDKDKSKDKDKDKDRGRDKDRNRDKDKDRDRDRSRDRGHSKDRDRDRDRSRSKSKDRDDHHHHHHHHHHH